MALTSKTILGGLYTHLTGDSTFNTAVGGTASTAGRIWFGLAKAGEAMPYCVMSEVSSGTFDTMGAAGLESRVSFQLVSDAPGGPADCVDLADKLRVRLDNATFTASGHEVLPAVLEDEVGPIRETDAWVLNIDYTIRALAT